MSMLVDSYRYGGGGPPPVDPVVTWNPDDRGPDIALDTELRVASHTGGVGYQSVRATHPLLPGRCFEIYLSYGLPSPYCAGGVATLAAPLGLLGASPEGYVYYQETGQKINSGTLVAYGAAYTNGDVIGVARIGNALHFWKNGIAQGKAFDLPGGVSVYPGASLYRGGHIIGARFKAADMSQLYGGCAAMGI